MFEKIDAKNLNLKNLTILSSIIHKEVETTVRFSKEKQSENISARNFICFDNMLRDISKTDFERAWWELVSMVDFHNQEDYISVNEAQMVNVALLIFIKEYSCFLKQNKQS